MVKSSKSSSTTTTESRAFGYGRVSSIKQVKGESLTVQRELIVAQAKRIGKRLVRIYEDPGVSGGIPLQKRPAGRQLLEAIEQGEIRLGDVIIASKLDRMFRSVKDAHTVAAIFKKRKISLNLLDLLGGTDVTGDGMAEAFFGIAAVFARLEASRIGERITEAKAVQRQKGLALGGDRPFGYRIGAGRAAPECEGTGRHQDDPATGQEKDAVEKDCRPRPYRLWSLDLACDRRECTQATVGS